MSAALGTRRGQESRLNAVSGAPGVGAPADGAGPECKKIEYNHLVRQRRCRENNPPSRTLTAMPGEVFTTDIALAPLA